MNRNVFLYLGLFLLLAACETTQNTTVHNYAYLYKKESCIFKPEFSIQHLSDDSSRVLIHFNTSDLTPVSDTVPLVSFTLGYSILNNLDGEKIMDSLTWGSFSVPQGQSLQYAFKVPLHKGSPVFQLRIRDLNKKVTYSSFQQVNKVNTNTRQFFYINRSQQALASNYITKDAFLKVSHCYYPAKRLTVKCFFRNFEPADPPFSMDHESNFNHKADSIFSLNDPQIDSFPIKKAGFYHIQSDPALKEGLTVFRFYEEFPYIDNSSQMIQPLRYITSRKEFEELQKNPDPRKALEKFWLEMGQNTDRSRELIRQYYSRVVETNRLFSSYKEGWKTDRGMIYIVYGAPNVVYRSPGAEDWIYGEPGSMLSNTFTFIKEENPFTDNDYILSRTPVYQNNWYNAIDIWRHGRAYNNN